MKQQSIILMFLLIVLGYSCVTTGITSTHKKNTVLFHKYFEPKNTPNYWNYGIAYVCDTINGVVATVGYSHRENRYYIFEITVENLNKESFLVSPDSIYLEDTLGVRYFADNPESRLKSLESKIASSSSDYAWEYKEKWESIINSSLRKTTVKSMTNVGGVVKFKTILNQEYLLHIHVDSIQFTFPYTKFP